MGYQSFPGEEKGASVSAEKLKALRLPSKLDGKSFLDLGCNEGYFCFEAKRRGAARVVGLDRNAEILEQARERAQRESIEVQFIDGDWTTLPSEKFDVILFSSALHYAKEPIALLQNIAACLTRDGLLVLECGVSPRDRSYGDFMRAIRAKGASKFYPSMNLLRNVWLRPYSARLVSKSVRQVGDPVDRYVFHCHQWETTVMFITGDGNIGKTSLALEVESDVIIRTDTFLSPKIDRRRKNIPEIEEKYRATKAELGTSIKNTWNSIREDPAVCDYYAAEIFQAIRMSRGARVVVVEGYVLSDLAERIEAKMKRHGGFRLWTATGT